MPVVSQVQEAEAQAASLEAAIREVAGKSVAEITADAISKARDACAVEACARSERAPLHALVLLAITTGARRDELLSLRWVDVDLSTGRATLHDTKNGEQRTLPLAGKALEALRQLKLQNTARSEYLFPSPTVVPDTEGGKPQLDAPYEHFDAHWYAALEAAGIKDFRFHDLRHTTASMLAAQGASLLEIGDVLEHKTLAMVKRYSHLVVDLVCEPGRGF
ncbi:MAG TPA: site-specific integrase [Steroidobacteraceae bacterium]|nr:site-specific integrase [Steroidobacteraceae bacterium]